MKNFSELLDTDPNLHVCIKLRAIADAGIPLVKVTVNGQEEINDPLSGSAMILTHIDCRQPFSIQIEMLDKIYKEDQETAVIIDAIRIDEHNLIPDFTHLAHYINDHGRDQPTSYLGWNGMWSLESDRPFYQWLHQHTGQGWLLEPI